MAEGEHSSPQVGGVEVEDEAVAAGVLGGGEGQGEGEQAGGADEDASDRDADYGAAGADDEVEGGAGEEGAGDGEEDAAADEAEGDDADGTAAAAADDDEAEEEEDDEAPARKRKRRQRQEERLDDDDYDLIEENTGRRLPRRDEAGGFRRLQKRAREPADDTDERAGAANDEALDDDAARRRIEAELFDDDDDDDGADDGADELAKPAREAEIGSDEDDDEDDNFIVDEEGNAVKLDEPDEEQGAEVEEAQDIFGTADELAELLAFTKHKGTAGDEAQPEAEGGDVSEAARAVAAVAMDGEQEDDDDDDDEPEEEMEGFDVDDEDDEDKAERERLRQAERVARRRAARSAAKQASANHAASKLAKLYPPEMLAANFMLPLDERIRALDVPERLQPRAADRPPPAEGELALEAEWAIDACADAWLRSADPRAPPPTAEALRALVGPVERALRCLRVELLEPPTIAAYRIDETAPLQEAWLWELHEADGRWARLQARKAQLRAQWARDAARLGLAAGDGGASAFEAALERANDNLAMTDLHEYLAVRQGVALRGSAAGGEGAAGAGKPVKHGLLAAAQRAGLDIVVAQVGLTSAQFATNLRDGWTTHTPVEPVDLLDATLGAFMAAALDEHGGRPPPGLPSGLVSDAKLAARELAAQQIATEPAVRALVRAHMLERALITVELTERGEALIDGAHAHSALRRYRGEPLRALLRAAPTAERPVPPPPLPRAERDEALLRFQRAKRAEADGLCTVKVALPDYGSLDRDELYVDFLRAYTVDAESALPDHDTDGAIRASWNTERAYILERALTGLLYARIGRQLEQQLAAEAQRALIRACQASFDAMLASARPLRDGDLLERRPLQRDAFSARAVLVAACKAPNEPTVFFAKLSADGELVDFLRTEWLHTSARRSSALGASGEWRTRSAADRARKLDEMRKLADFFAGEESGAPAFCVLGASHLRCRELKAELDNLARALAVRARLGDAAFDAYNECPHPKGRVEFVDGPLGVERVERAPLHDTRPSSTMTAAEMDAEAPFRVLFASEAVPALYAASTMAQKELGDRHPLLWRATSLGRMAQDSLVETAHVCGHVGAGLGSLQTHPLQDALPRTVRVNALLERMVSWVARVGVRLPWVLAHGAQGRNLLQYVPGLGPRKSARLFEQLMTLAQSTHEVAARDELLDRRLLGRRVYANAAPFVYFTPIPTGSGGLTHDADAEVEIEPTLEITRVHPEHYEYAIQLCVQAAADDEQDELPAPQESLRLMIGNREGLQLLELSEYARFLRGEEMEGAETLAVSDRRELELQLEAMRRALIEAYVDPRAPIRKGVPELAADASELPVLPELLSDAELFEQLTGDTRESLVGMILGATAVRAGNRERVAGMWCQLENGMQAHLPADAMADAMRELSVDEYPVQPGDSFHCVILSPTDIDLAKCECVISCRTDDLTRADFRSVAEQRAANERPAAPKIPLRKISHPLFQNVTGDKAVSILQQGAPGDVLFRPSKKGTDHLSMSWLWTTNVIIHVDIVEQDKPTPDQLGRTLLVSGQEGSYEALDEIHARYAAPISDLVSEAASHRKFTSLRRREEVESLLRRDKEEAPESIPYRVSVSEHAQTKACLVLTFLPSKSIRREYIAVKPNGFELKRQVHATLDMLLVWFKRNYKTMVAPPPQPPPQRRPPPPPAPPVSSWPRQEHMGAWGPANTAAANARANAQAASNFLGGLMG